MPKKNFDKKKQQSNSAQPRPGKPVEQVVPAKKLAKGKKGALPTAGPVTTRSKSLPKATSKQLVPIKKTPVKSPIRLRYSPPHKGIAQTDLTKIDHALRAVMKNYNDGERSRRALRRAAVNSQMQAQAQQKNEESKSENTSS